MTSENMPVAAEKHGLADEHRLADEHPLTEQHRLAEEDMQRSLLKRIIALEEDIRELKNVIGRAVIQAEDIPAFDLASVEKLHIQRVLNYTQGNKVEAARLLNIGLTTVYRKLEEYGLH